jgi:hypothetical protein
MRLPVTHINLLQRTAPAHTAAWTLAALLALTVVGTAVHGSKLRSQAHEAASRRDDVAQQLKEVQARLAVQNGEQVKSAATLTLRKEVDALQPQAQLAQTLIDAAHHVEGGRTDEFARPLAAITGLNETGLWLTALTLSAGGKRMELQGQASNGASVLRYARRANESLQPLTLHLDTLELQPATGVAGSGAGAGAGVSFRLY